MCNVNPGKDFGFWKLVLAVEEGGQAHLPDHELTGVEFDPAGKAAK
jgi:hypothetical protein